MSSPTYIERFRQQVRTRGDTVAVRYRPDSPGSTWVEVTWNQWNLDASRLACGLQTLGLRPGERVAICAGSRYEWAVADIGVALARGVMAPLYADVPPARVVEMLARSGARILLLDNDSLFDAVCAARNDLSSLIYVVRLPTVTGSKPLSRSPDPGAWLQSYAQVLALGEAKAGDLASVSTPWCPPGSDDLATVVYTAGTAGRAKGVCLSHGNIAHELTAIHRAISIGPDDVQLLFLPMAHVLGRMLFLAGMSAGAVTVFGRGVGALIDDLGACRPTFIGSVPSVYCRIFSKLMQSSGAGGALRRQALGLALDLIQRSRSGGTRGLLALGERAAFRGIGGRLRELLGGRIRFVLCGGAAIPNHVAQLFHAAGVPLLPGYGLTESTAASHVSQLDDWKLGSVGRPVESVECRVDGSGEVLLRGPTIMLGYDADDNELANTLVETTPATPAEGVYVDDEGWLHTGDCGHIDADGHLFLRGRRKELLVTAGGKNVAPAPIEHALCASPLVGHAVVFGDDKPFLSALLTLEPEPLQAWCAEQGFPNEDFATRTRRKEVGAAVEAHVARVNETLAGYEAVRRHVILDRMLSVADGELTPTLKVRRSAVAQKHARVLDELYRDCF